MLQSNIVGQIYYSNLKSKKRQTKTTKYTPILLKIILIDPKGIQTNWWLLMITSRMKML